MTSRVILGLFDGVYRLRVSKPGYSALAATLATNRLAFDSTWADAANIVASGTASYYGGAVGGFYRLTTFPAQPSPPFAIVFKGRNPFNSDSPQIDMKIDRTTIWLRAGFGLDVPSGTFSYIVSKAMVLG